MEDVKGLSFEQAMAELEGIVRKFEEGQVSLEEAITFYERGNSLKAHCEGKLKDAELRVEKIVAGEAGQITSAPIAAAGEA
ncbi:MAG: exodeoxyribonuclease VII small subunit [Alphaproteobacteria bacterium]